ncbi:MAG: glycosyltransferase [Candidatus Bathyarchaeia archaeon]
MRKFSKQREENRFCTASSTHSLVPSVRRLWFRAIRFLQIYGLGQGLRRLKTDGKVFFVRRVQRIINNRKYRADIESLSEILHSHSGFFDCSFSPIGWNTKMFQRYQHMSNAMSVLGGLSLYGGNPRMDTSLFVYFPVHQNLYVFDATDKFIKQKLLETLSKSKSPVIVRLYSVDMNIGFAQVMEWLKRGFHVVYEYIDLLTPEISGFIPKVILFRHEQILRNEKIFVVATSNRLLDDVKRYRSKNFILNTNGVDVSHWTNFSDVCPSDMQPIVSTGRHIVGYHGTLAEWIDYECLRAIAEDGKYELVLIGLEHDTSFRRSGLHHHPRVHYLGSKPYYMLNEYAARYDVAILPFIKTDVTDTVSPVKIFEYMASGKPIVTTDLLECQKYRSCLIAHDTHEFLKNLEKALAYRKEAWYRSLLATEAQENSWQQKAKEILRFIGMTPL